MAFNVGVTKKIKSLKASNQKNKDLIARLRQRIAVMHEINQRNRIKMEDLDNELKEITKKKEWLELKLSNVKIRIKDRNKLNFEIQRSKLAPNLFVQSHAKLEGRCNGEKNQNSKTDAEEERTKRDVDVHRLKKSDDIRDSLQNQPRVKSDEALQHSRLLIAAFRDDTPFEKQKPAKNPSTSSKTYDDSGSSKLLDAKTFKNSDAFTGEKKIKKELLSTSFDDPQVKRSPKFELGKIKNMENSIMPKNLKNK